MLEFQVDQLAKRVKALEEEVRKLKGEMEPAQDDVRAVFEYWHTHTAQGSRVKLTDGRRRKIATRLKSYTVEELCAAVRANWASPFHRDRGLTDVAWVLHTPERVDHWITKAKLMADDPRQVRLFEQMAEEQGDDESVW